MIKDVSVSYPHVVPNVPFLLLHMQTGVLPDNSSIDQVRHLIASLKVALEYCRMLSAAMLPLGQLLAHPAGEVVQETIRLLTLCW